MPATDELNSYLFGGVHETCHSLALWLVLPWWRSAFFVLWSQRDKQQAPAESGLLNNLLRRCLKADEPVTASWHFDFERSVLRAGDSETRRC